MIVRSGVKEDMRGKVFMISGVVKAELLMLMMMMQAVVAIVAVNRA